jgi:two-component system response regulator GlrR
MPMCRCAVVTDDSVDMGSSVAQSLTRIRDLELVSLSLHSASSAPAEFDAFVFVACSGSLPVILEQVSQLRSNRPGCAILVAGAQLDTSELTALFGAGVYDFVSIPFSDDEFATRLRRAVGLVSLPEPNGERTLINPHLRNFIGSSPAFVKQLAKLPTFAGCDAGVLIFGETGTGKEICAQAIHYLSARASKPWVAVNCGAIAIELIESEMFGHVRGAYTTAHASTPGLVREAEGGTLFLDDVDCLPLSAQAKLLRFLQEREYRPVGTTTVYRADVRVIAASNHRLSQLVARGEFRQDLFFRLNVLTLDLPPLRERDEDIPELARHFVRKFAEQIRRPVVDLSPQALKRLLAYDWPGNVRELKNVLERAVLMASNSMLGVEDLELTSQMDGDSDGESFRDAKDRVVKSFERGFIEKLLLAHSGNVTHAAQAARKNRRAFFQLMRKHCIEPARFRTNQL